MNFNGVELRNDTAIMNNNRTYHSRTEIVNYAPFLTNMKSARIIRLVHRAEDVGDWTNKQTQQYELGIVQYFQK